MPEVVKVSAEIKEAFIAVIKEKNLGGDQKCFLAHQCLEGTNFDTIYATEEDRIAAALKRTDGKITLDELNAKLPEGKKLTEKEKAYVGNAIKNGALKQDKTREQPLGAKPAGGGPKQMNGPTQTSEIDRLVEEFLASNEPAASEYGGRFTPKAPIRGTEPGAGQTV